MERLSRTEVMFIILLIAFIIGVFISPDNHRKVYFYIVLFVGLYVILYVIYALHKGEIQVFMLLGDYKIKRIHEPNKFWYIFIIEFIGAIIIIILSLILLYRP